MSRVFALGVVNGEIKALNGAIDTIQNVNITTDKWGKQRGLEFTGNSYIKLVDDELRNFSADTDFTVSLWFKYESTSLAYDVIYGNTDEYNSMMARNNYKPQPYFAFPTTDKYNIYYINKTISTTDWHHLVLVRRGTTATMYIDGVGTKFDVSDNTYNLKTMYIGWDGKQNNAWLNGIISDLVIFRDEARWTEDFTPPKAPLLANYLYLDSNNAVWGCKS